MAGFRWRFLLPAVVLTAVLLALGKFNGRHMGLFVVGAVLTILVLVVVVLFVIHRKRAPRSSGDPADAGSTRLPPPALIGRAQEIDALVEMHDRIRRERADSTMARPVVLHLYGMAGVGKSALANAAATAIRARVKRYSGPVSVNLNGGGEPTALGHVLADLLRQMRWGGPVPRETAARIKLFRAFAAERQPLIVLDAVTDAAQIAGLIPNSDRCCVIVTSRRNLGPALGVDPVEVRPLRRSSSLQLLRAITQTETYVAAVCAAQLVEISGGLPIAIRAIGERAVFEGKSLCTMNATLRPKRTRLQELTRAGVPVTDGIAEEFDRLSPDEARALCLLTLLPTPTVASWVVAPLLDVSALNGERVMTELVNARLLQPAGRDRWFDLPRYRMNAVVRLYAESRLNRDAELLGDCHVAVRRLQTVFRLLGARLAGYRPAETAWPDVARQWMPKPRVDGTGRAVHHWIRAEMLNLAEVARAALADEPALAWRLCGLFGENFPEFGEHLPAGQWPADLSVTLNRAGDAARDAGQPDAELDVRLAELNLHSSTGHFVAAEQSLGRIDAVAAGSDHNRAGTGGLILARAYLMAFQTARAREVLDRTARWLPHSSPETVRRAAVLRAVVAGVPVRDLPAGADPALVAVAATRENAGHGRELIVLLRELQHAGSGDLSDAIAVHQRLARAYLGTFHAVGGRPSHFLEHAGNQGILAVVAAERIADRGAVVRGRCLLAEVMVAAGHLREVHQHLDHAEAQLRKMPELVETVRTEMARMEELGVRRQPAL